MKFVVLVVVFLLAFAIPSTVFALSDNLYLTVPPGGDRFIVLQLPDDSGWQGRGEVEYTVTMAPSPQQTWSDFSEQIVRTDENNTVQIPIYFSKKTNSSCGAPFTLTVSAPSVGAMRVINGGACESAFAVVSTGSALPNQSVGSAINQDFGLLDLAFAEQGYYVQPGGIANITVLAASNQGGAAISVKLAAGSLGISPSAHEVSLGAEGGQVQLQFEVHATNASGTYDLVLEGVMEGCSAQACSTTKRAKLVVGDAPPAKGGFSAQLFPTAMNTEQGSPVVFRLTIYNNEAGRSFDVSMPQVYGIETDFREATIAVGGGSQQSVEFNVTPTGALSSYEFSINVKSEENSKIVTGYVNVNGMDAGAQRGLEMVQATGNQSAMAQASQAYGSFHSDPSLDGYGSLQDELDRLARQPASAQNASNGTVQPATQPQNYTYPAANNQGLDLLGKDIWILVVIVGVVFAASILFYTGGRNKGVKTEFKGGSLSPE